MKAGIIGRGKIRDHLVLGIVAVVLLSGLTTYGVVLASFRHDFDALVETNDLETAASFASSLAEFYKARGSWSEVGDEIDALRHSPAQSRTAGAGRSFDKKHPMDSDIPLVLTDESGNPIYSGMHAKDGKRETALPARLKIAHGKGIAVDGKTVGYVFFKSMVFRSYNPQESAYIASLTRSITLSVAIGLILALALGTFLAARFARPIAALDSAVKTIAEGDMSARVGVGRNDEIGSLAGNFNLMADRLQAAEAARQNLLADIAHELRTPVSIIQANLEMIIDGVYSADAERLKSLYDETRILTNLITDLRSLSDLEVGIAPMRSERVRISAVAEESCAKLRPLFDERGIRLGSPPSSEEMLVSAQEDKLRQVFRNILGNALKYAPSGSTVTLSLERVPSAEGGVPAIKATIEDEGEGVPEGETEKIFERFYRVDSSRSRESGGRGLGLAICKTIVEAFGGKIGAYNRKPRGLAVWFELPAEGSS
jgi:signal transduction histidine kinase